MSSWPVGTGAEAAGLEHRRRERRAAAKRRAVAPLRNGVATIVIVAGLLAGLVAVNVAVLLLNVRLVRLGQERAKLRDENAALASQLSSAQASPRIAAQARARGLVQADPSRITYVELGRSR